MTERELLLAKKEYEQKKVENDIKITQYQELQQLEQNPIVQRYLELQQKASEKPLTDEELKIKILKKHGYISYLNSDICCDIYCYMGAYVYDPEDLYKEKPDYYLYKEIETGANFKCRYQQLFEATHQIIKDQGKALDIDQFEAIQKEYYQEMLESTPKKAQEKIKTKYIKPTRKNK